jgi:hypothetical protein
MSVIDLKQVKSKRAPRELVEIDKDSAAGRFFEKLVRDIEADLAGRRNLSRIESEFVQAFAGAATTLRYLNHQVLLGEISEIDLGGYATIASTMLRLGSRLGVSRRAVKPSPDFYKDRLPQLAQQEQQERQAEE